MEKKLVLGEIEIDDGEFAKEELDKALEKSEKETEKELAKSEKIVIDEINDAEADKVDLKDGSGKKFKIKEDLDEDVRDVKGLGNADKKARYFANYNNQNIDFHNAEYKEISPEEAMKLFKDGKGNNLRLVIDGRLVTIKDRGYGSSDYNLRVKWVPNEKAYVKKSGERVIDTTYMPLSHLIKIADKIVVTNERDVRRDPAQRAARSVNPESPNFKGFEYSLRDRNRSNTWHDDDIRGTAYHTADSIQAGKRTKDNYYREKVTDYLGRLKELKARLAAGEINQETYNDEHRSYMDSLKYWARSAYGNKDNFARANFANSEYNLQKELFRYETLKNTIDDKLRHVKEAEKDYNNAVEYGSEETRNNRERLKDAKEQLKNLHKKIAVLELKLEDTSEDDKKAAQKYKDRFDKINNEYNEMQAELDTILRRNK